MKPLEIVRGCARLECAAVEQGGSGRLYSLSRLQYLGFRLYRTWTRYYLKMPFSNLYSPHVQYGLANLKFFVGLFEGVGKFFYGIDYRQAFENTDINTAGIPDKPDYRLVAPFGNPDSEPEGLKPVT